MWLTKKLKPPVIFRTNPVKPRTDPVIFKTNSVLFRTNAVIFRRKLDRNWDSNGQKEAYINGQKQPETDRNRQKWIE